MANNFSNDSNCVALYLFENDTTDSKGNNDLTNTGIAFNTTKKEGTYAGVFETSDYGEITNANLDSGFPGKNGESFTALSIAAWVRFSSGLSTSQVIACVWNATANARCWALKTLGSATIPRFEFLKGYNAGASFETFDHAYTSLATSVWYHVQVSYLESSKVLLFGVWDDTYAGYRQDNSQDFGTATFVQSTNVEDEEFNIGRYGQSLYYLNGSLDELAVFKDVVTASEFSQIRQGAYGPVSLTVADLAHSHSLDNVAVTQANTLAPADLAHAHALDSPTLEIAGTLVVADLAHGHALDNVALTQANTLAVNDLAHGHSLDNISLAGVYTLDSSFECGNGVEDSPFQSGNTVNIVTECDPSPAGTSWGDWFYFKLSGVNDMAPEVNIDFTNDRGGGPLWNTHGSLRPVWSYDRATWTRISSVSYNSTSHILTFTLPTMAGNDVYLAMDVPYSYSDLQTDVAAWDESPYCTVQTLSYGGISTSQGGRNLYYLKIEEPGYYTNLFDFVITGRSHPGEPQASHHLKGFIDWVLSADAAAIEFRRKSILYIFPMVNPDGVVAGRLRSYNDGTDANRNFDAVNGPSSTYEPNETFLVHSQIHAVNANVTLCLDSHSNNYTSARLVYDSVHDDWTTQERSDLVAVLNGHDTADYWYDSIQDMVAEDTTGWRCGQITQYGYHALGIEGGIYADNAGVYPTAAQRRTAGGVMLQSLIDYSEAASIILAVADLAHGHALDNVTLNLAVTLAVAALAHGHSLDNVALTQANTLTVGDLLHMHSLDNVAITQANTLAVADMLHGHSLDSMALTQAHVLAVGDLAHGHILDNVALSSAMMLIAADLLHGHSLDNVAITQAHVLQAQDLFHLHPLAPAFLLLSGATPLMEFTGKAGVFEFTGKTQVFTFNATAN